MTGSSLRRQLGALGLAAALLGCRSAGGNAGGNGAGSPSAAVAASPADPFTGLPYRLDLPTGWIVLGSALNCRPLTKSSQTGVELGMTESHPLLAALGGRPADLRTAMAVPETPPLLVVTVTRLRGVPADRLLAAIVAQRADTAISTVSVGGRELTYVPGGAWPVWYLVSGSDLYGITADEATLADVVELLPLSG
jgi:hypothetical protein